MRIDLVCGSRDVFGADRSALRLAHLLRELGNEPRLTVPASRPERGLTQLARNRGIKVFPEPVVVASSRGLSGLEKPRRGRKRRQNADVVIYNSSAVVPWRANGTPTALVLREWLAPDSRRHRLLSRAHKRRVSTVVAVSHGVADQWRHCCGDRVPVRVIWNWLDDRWLERSAPVERRQGIVFAGRLNAWKGQMHLADAFERAFAKRKRRPSLTFIGAEGPASPFHAQKKALKRRCDANGWRLLPVRASLDPVLQRASLLVVPSLRPEPFGNVILEALASGCRVIAFPGGGPDDLEPHFRGVLKVVPRGRDSLASALLNWWQEGAAAQTPNEHKHVKQSLQAHFSHAAARDRWRSVLEELAVQPNAPEEPTDLIATTREESVIA